MSKMQKVIEKEETIDHGEWLKQQLDEEIVKKQRFYPSSNQSDNRSEEYDIPDNNSEEQDISVSEIEEFDMSDSNSEEYDMPEEYDKPDTKYKEFDTSNHIFEKFDMSDNIIEKFDLSKVYEPKIDPDKVIKKIPLTNKDGVIVVEALCDEEDYNALTTRLWNYDDGYAHSTNGRMHLIVVRSRGVKVRPGFGVHHINHIRHDNRFSNLIVVPIPINSQCVAKNKRKSSDYHGVSIHRNRIHASVSVNHVRHLIGTFNTELEAAEAYDRFIAHQDSFHQMNKPEMRSQYKKEPMIFNLRKPAASGFKGVLLRKDGKFVGCLQINKITHQQPFKTDVEAAKWYDQQVIKHGLDRPLNFPKDQLTSLQSQFK